MILTEVSTPPPAAIPVRELARHLRLSTGFPDDGSEDGILELYLRAAMAAVEARLGFALLTRVFSWNVTQWQCEASQGLPIGPVQSVDEIVFVGGDGVETSLDPEGWSLLKDARRPRLIGRDGRRLPAIPRHACAEIRFTAGFGPDWESVPADIRQAVFLLAAHYYEHRSEDSSAYEPMPFGVLVLIETYRTMRIGAGS
jgi:uncharacterized phiE125 gp8 family phage protein